MTTPCRPTTTATARSTRRCSGPHRRDGGCCSRQRRRRAADKVGQTLRHAAGRLQWGQPESTSPSIAVGQDAARLGTTPAAGRARSTSPCSPPANPSSATSTATASTIGASTTRTPECHPASVGSRWNPFSRTLVVRRGRYVKHALPAIADYDGDGKDDHAVYTPTTTSCKGGTWTIWKSTTRRRHHAHLGRTACRTPLCGPTTTATAPPTSPSGTAPKAPGGSAEQTAPPHRPLGARTATSPSRADRSQPRLARGLDVAHLGSEWARLNSNRRHGCATLGGGNVTRVRFPPPP